MNNTDNPTSRKNNVNSEVQKVEKNNQLLSSLKDKLSKLSNHIWLRKVEGKTEAIKMVDMTPEHLQNIYYATQHKMDNHWEKIEKLEKVATQIEEVANHKGIKLKDADNKYVQMNKAVSTN